jgi:hypothetical protein
MTPLVKEIVRNCTVGDATLGSVFKDYRVSAAQ